MIPLFFISNRLFQEDANLLAIFVKFQSLKTPEAQRTDEELAKHATLVMETLDESISSLDKPDYFIEYLESVGKRHRKVDGFKKEYFWVSLFPFPSYNPFFMVSLSCKYYAMEKPS